MFVACLCAEWCTVCREYRPIFDAVAAESPDARFLWIDIEASAGLLDGIDVENFPTIVIARGERLDFFGQVHPIADVLRRLGMAAQRTGPVTTTHDPELIGLVRRLRRLAFPS